MKAHRTWKLFQSTHSHGVRLFEDEQLGYVVQISINALAWSATLSLAQKKFRPLISINALAWSATLVAPI